MQVLIIPDKFKTTLSSAAAAQALEKGISRGFSKAAAERIILSDGGEGFLECLEQVYPLQRISVIAPGPDGKTRECFIGFHEEQQTVYIESSQVTGFHLLKPEERHPFKTSSAGLSRLLEKAFSLQAKEIYIGLGSSATCDAGTPAAEAFGHQFINRSGIRFSPRPCELSEILTVLPPKTNPLSAQIHAVCDVHNPPLGSNGGVRIYSPQKGASPTEVEILESGIGNLINCLQPDCAENLTNLKGGGAAGCLGLGLHVFFHADLIPGSEFIPRFLNLREKILHADVIITGEGSFDEQSLSGKMTGEIIRQSLKNKKKIFLVTGKKKIPEKSLATLSAHFSVESLQEEGFISSIRESEQALEEIGRRIGLLLARSAG